eukprot:925147-Amorphochlora_amoeboformis.AAC.1
MSYMPDFSERDQEAQINYMIQNGLIPCVEFDKNGDMFRENSKMPGYYDGRYWTMWKLPMFGATDARSVMAEVKECQKYNPSSYIRILGFDNIKQVQCMGFLVAKPGGASLGSGASFSAASAPRPSSSFGAGSSSFGAPSSSFGGGSSSGGFTPGKWTRPVE